MTAHRYPRPESAAHKVVCRLVDLGGKALISQLISVLPAELHSVGRFNRQVIDQVVAYGLATVTGDVFTATPKGKAMSGAHAVRHLPPAKPYVGSIAAVRVPPPMRPLNTAKHFPQLVVREGAFDHQKIPSLMGGKRIFPRGSTN